MTNAERTRKRRALNIKAGWCREHGGVKPVFGNRCQRCLDQTDKRRPLKTDRLQNIRKMWSAVDWVKDDFAISIIVNRGLPMVRVMRRKHEQEQGRKAA